jgi:hypothetical protein
MSVKRNVSVPLGSVGAVGATGSWQPVNRQLGTGNFEEGQALIVRQLQPLGQPFGNGQGGPTFIRLDFAQCDDRAADLLCQLIAAQQ